MAGVELPGGKTFSGVARNIGVTPQTVINALDGRAISWKTAVKIGQELNVAPEVLIRKDGVANARAVLLGQGRGPRNPVTWDELKEVE